MLEFIMGCLCYGSLSAMVVLIVYATITGSMDFDDQEVDDYE